MLPCLGRAEHSTGCSPSPQNRQAPSHLLVSPGTFLTSFLLQTQTQSFYRAF